MHESIGKVRVNAERQSLVPQLVPSIAQVSTAKQPQRGTSSLRAAFPSHRDRVDFSRKGPPRGRFITDIKSAPGKPPYFRLCTSTLRHALRVHYLVNLVCAVTAKPSHSGWSLVLLDSHTALFFMPGGYIPNAIITPARALCSYIRIDYSVRSTLGKHVAFDAADQGVSFGVGN